MIFRVIRSGLLILAAALGLLVLAAPAAAMECVTGEARSTSGRIIPGASVLVTVKTTGLPALIYSDGAGTIPKANPFDTTTATGVYRFCAANGHYALTFTKSGYTFDATETADLTLWDQDDSAAISAATVPSYGVATLPAAGTPGRVARLSDGGATGAIVLDDGTNWTCNEAKSQKRALVTCPPYNADPTGVADSTAALNLARDSGLTVHLPFGTYRTTARWTWTTAPRIISDNATIRNDQAAGDVTDILYLDGTAGNLVGAQVLGHLWLQFQTRDWSVDRSCLRLTGVYESTFRVSCRNAKYGLWLLANYTFTPNGAVVYNRFYPEEMYQNWHDFHCESVTIAGWCNVNEVQGGRFYSGVTQAVDPLVTSAVQIYVAGKATVLTADITDVAPGAGDALNVEHTEWMPATGTLKIGTEQITYSAKPSATSVTVAARGANGTAAAAHTTIAVITELSTEPYLNGGNIFRGVSLEAIDPAHKHFDLGGMGNILNPVYMENSSGSAIGTVGGIANFIDAAGTTFLDWDDITNLGAQTKILTRTGSLLDAALNSGAYMLALKVRNGETAMSLQNIRGDYPLMKVLDTTSGLVRWQLGENNLVGYRSGEAQPRITIDNYNGYIYIGDGVTATPVRLGYYAAGLGALEIANHGLLTPSLAVGGGSTVTKMMNGAAVVADGATIAHGLGSAPTLWFVQCIVPGEICTATADATNLTVSIKTGAGAPGTAQSVKWQVLK